MSVDLGQHFLHDREVLGDIITVADVRTEDVVLEIGPGKGVLTEELAKKAKRVIAVELDRGLVAALQKKFKNAKNVTIIHEDILRWWGREGQLPTSSSPATIDAPARRLTALRPRSSSLRDEAVPARSAYAAGAEHRQGSRLKDCGFKVVANIPYRITAPILRMFLEGTPCPSLMVLMVQKEVAERVCAEPGQMSLLSVSVQYYAKPEIVRIVPRTAFDPPPKVDSAILRIHPLKNRVTKNVSIETKSVMFEKRFFQLVKLGFSSRRKQLQNLLASGLHIANEDAKKALQAVGLDTRIRAQELSIDDWKRLTPHLSSNKH
ncbi:16S rRNA (adenine(1518)-N(6)/adenine(1519)-N(6))-dimethyltransferase [Candidatus Uhrbacteria bacterium]|nr:16S rRNA (adenine(1518)-N(6)/adenine(1519)-N(6))-dimethyltransferase [Candidatus Uhrbacteria bacterium]